MSLKSFTEWIALTFLIIFLLRKHFQISPDKTYFTPEAYLPPIIKAKVEQTHTCACKIGSPTAELANAEEPHGSIQPWSCLYLQLITNSIQHNMCASYRLTKITKPLEVKVWHQECVWSSHLKSPMFALKADAWFAPAEHCLCIPVWQSMGIYHQNNPRNIYGIFKWLKTECMSFLSPSTPNCIQLCFMLLHRAAKTLERCLPTTNKGTYIGNSACSQKWNELKRQCSESPSSCSLWSDMEIGDGKPERITFPLSLSMPFTYHLSF